MPEQERRARILVIDDEAPVREALAEILEDEGYEVITAGSGEQGVDRALADHPDVIFLDIWLPGIDGLEALRMLRERGARAPVIMISGHGTIETAVKATKLGAYDFVEKPVSLERVLLVASHALRHVRLERRNRALRAELRREAEFLGRSEAVEELRVELAAAADAKSVLLHGEKGSGRRLAARWLSLHGLRPEGPFLDVQASALSRERLIATLYGQAHHFEDPGHIALADEGTLYLENADDLPAAVQASLVAGCREGSYPVPGQRRKIRSGARLVVALLEDPGTLLEQGRLSEAFVASFPHVIEIPPLRRRREDIPELAERFLREICREYAREELRLSPSALEAMLAYRWPGNVRELKRALERVVLLAEGPSFTAADLPRGVTGASSEGQGVEATLRRFERSWLRRHLAEAGGDLARTAARLGISQEELAARLERFGIEANGSSESL